MRRFSLLPSASKVFVAPLFSSTFLRSCFSDSSPPGRIDWGQFWVALSQVLIVALAWAFFRGRVELEFNRVYFERVGLIEERQVG